MKLIPISTLRSAAETNPKIWHDALHIGKVIGGMTIELPDDFPLDAPTAPAAPYIQPSNLRIPALMKRDPDEVKRIDEICAQCDWNQDWICQHPGCLPCRQHKEGGLRAVIAIAVSTCPDGKWNSKYPKLNMDARKSGVLGKRQEIIADQAEIILRGLAHVGIIALVDGRPRANARASAHVIPAPKNNLK